MEAGLRGDGHYLVRDGFDYAFDPSACRECRGRCCRGESGTINVTSPEIQDIAAFLQTCMVDFMHTFLVRAGNRLSIREVAVESESACVFFDLQESRCLVYPVRPAQCRTFPFWDHFKQSRELLADECPGIRDRG